MGYHIDLLDDLVNGNVTDDLIKIKENFLELDGSRIVEHNLNILSPTNGYYVRWENGLQVVYMSFDPLIETSGEMQVYYPASFVAIPAAHLSFATGQNPVYREAISSAYIMVQAQHLLLVKPKTSTITTREARVFAIGRWK